MTVHETIIVRPIMRLLALFFLKCIGWQVEGKHPNIPKYVMIAAPHTSNWDFVIALAMAFSKLLKSNAKEHINVLIIDEILDGLDQEGKNRVMELLSKIRSLTNLFVISHDPTIKNAEHDRVWTIIKEGSVATMRVA